jgi:hypothetical protein
MAAGVRGRKNEGDSLRLGSNSASIGQTVGALCFVERPG